jgi:hypothetical protein
MLMLMRLVAERPIRLPLSLPLAPRSSDLHLVQGKRHAEGVYLWPDYHTHELYVLLPDLKRKRTLTSPVLPFINILLDLVIGGLGKALCGLIGLLVAHAW